MNDRVTIDGTPFIVNVSGRQRSVNSVMMRIHYRTQTRTIRSNAFGRIDLYYEDLPTPIDWTPEAYNTLKGKDFKNVAAHELGHDILTESMGRNFSWTHKGTSTLLSQEVLPSAPNYPDSPTDQDLMYYYNEPPPTPPATRYYLSADVHERIIAYDEDVRRLIWLGQIRFRRSREGS